MTPAKGDPDRVEVDEQGLQILDTEACVALLGSVSLGRIALTYRALPVILPVAFALKNGDVLFGVGKGALAKAADSRQIVCFQIDHLDAGAGEAWSVCAVGQLSVLSTRQEIDEAERLDLGQWSPLSRRFVRLVPEIFTGRSSRVL